MWQPRVRHAIGLAILVTLLAITAAWATLEQADPLDDETSRAIPTEGLRVLHRIDRDMLTTPYRPISPGQTLTFDDMVIETHNITQLEFSYVVRISGPSPRPHPFHTTITSPNGTSWENDTATIPIFGGATQTTIGVTFDSIAIASPPDPNETGYPTFDPRVAYDADAARHTHTNGTGTWKVEIRSDDPSAVEPMEVQIHIVINHYEAHATERIGAETDDTTETEDSAATDDSAETDDTSESDRTDGHRAAAHR